MLAITQILQIFSSEWPSLKLGRSRYYGSENELHLILESGTRIIFALQGDGEVRDSKIPKSILDQILTFRTYISSNPLKLTDGSVAYIDARIPFKLFVCSDPIICQKNLNLIYGNTAP
jgi:hypothetical protein